MMQESKGLKTPADQPALFPLLTAAQTNDWETVTKLFSKPIQLTERDAEGKTLIHFAALYGHADFLQQHCALLREEWVNAKDEQGATPLYLATRNRHWACVKLLLHAKADLQAPTPDGRSLIAHWVSSISDPAVLEDLLSTQTPAVQRACLLTDSEGVGLLHHAAAAGQTAVVQWLADRVDIQSEEPNGAAAHPLISINACDLHGYTPLYQAIKYGHTGTVAALLAHGASIHLANINGDNPIHHALRLGQLDIAQQLTTHLFKTLGVNQRPEYPALLQAFHTLYAYHHRPTAERFFKQAQAKHVAQVSQQRLDSLVYAQEEDIKQAENDGMAPVEPLSRKTLETQFQKHQLNQALEQFYALLKPLSSHDALIPILLFGLSEAYLQKRSDPLPDSSLHKKRSLAAEEELHKKHDYAAYEKAMGYAASANVHYQHCVKGTLQENGGYEALLSLQENRILITYRQEVFGQMDAFTRPEMLAQYRQKLATHRHQLKQEREEGKNTPDLLKENTAFFNSITANLWARALRLTKQQPPCRYALLSLGSMSKQEMCPYSDLEFALLLERDDETTKIFFQRVVHVMHLLVIGLGETPLIVPCQIPFSITIKGYNFDEGGNTPLHEEFMATPAVLADLQRQSGDALIIARNVLRITGWIAGDERLHQHYQSLLHQALSEKFALPGSSFFSVFSTSIERRHTQALEILEGALPEFSPSSLTQARHGRGLDQLNIKTDLYRLPTQVIESLSLYFNATGNTTFEKLDNLGRKNIIHRQTVERLNELLHITLTFRLDTHLYYDTEEESVAYQAVERDLLLPREKPVYVLEEAERAALLSVYQILLPLESAVRAFVSSKGKTNPFQQTLLHSQGELAKHPALKHHLEARSYERLFSPDKALGSYRQALQLDPDNSDIHLHYVAYIHSLRDMRQRSQASYEATAISYVKQLADQLLTFHAQHLLTLSGFDLYYEALPLTLRPTFRANFNTHNPLHRRLIERLDRIDNLPKEELEKTHQESKAAIAVQAARVLENLPAAEEEKEEKEEKTVAGPSRSNKTAQAAELSRITTLLKIPANASAEGHVVLLTHSFSLLTALVEADKKQITQNNQEIEKSLDKVTQFLLTPNKSGVREQAPFLKFYRQLPCEVRPAFRHALLKQQETLTQSGQQTLKQQQADLDFFTALLKTLNEEPDEAGQRESWQAHKQAWQETLHSLVEEETPGKNSVCLVSPLLDKQGKQHTRYPLKTAIREALLDEVLAFRANSINGSEHRVVRLKLKQKDGTSKELYCKAYPEMPGMTYLIERLHHRMIGHGTCLSELVKIERPGKPPIPVLVSEAIPGPTLHEVLKKDPQRLQQLDHQTYSDLILLAILTNPEDGLPTNYIVTPKEAGEEAVTLVSVDHDHALFPPYLLEPVTATPSEAKHATNDNDGEEPEEEKQSFKPKLQIKTILFCLEAMHKPIDLASRDALLRLNPAKVLTSVLREAQVQNDYYGQLFDSQTVKAFHENRANKTNFFKADAKNKAENCTIPIPLKEGDAIKLYQKLHRLQQFLTKYPQATLLQCLLHTEPRVGMAYTRALDDYCDPLERLLHLGEYPVNLQGQMVTSTHAIKSLRLQTQQIGAEQYADLKDLTPAQGLAELDLMTYQQDALDSIREEVMRGDLKRFLALKAPEHKAAIISGIGTQRKGIDWAQLDATQQRALLDALEGIPFTHLDLSGCTVLTKKQLTQLLVQSPDCTVLNLSGHPSLDELWLLEIAKNARHLKELTIRQAPRLQHIRTRALFHHLNTLDIADNPALEIVNIRAPQLKLLHAKNCPKLHTLQTTSQQLREVDVSGNNALRLHSGLAHQHSAYTLNRLKLAGCTQLTAKNIKLLSVYPVLLWTSSKSRAQIKMIALLDQYIGRLEDWQSLSTEQKKQVLVRMKLFEHQEDVLIFSLKAAKNMQVFVREIAQKALASFVPYVSTSQLQKILSTALQGTKDKENDVRQAAHCTLAALTSRLSASPLQGILDAVLTGMKDWDSNVRRAAQHTFVALGPRLSASQIQGIVNTALAEAKNKNWSAREAAQETLAALTPHATASQLQEILDAVLTGMEDWDSNVRGAAQHTLVAVGPYLSASQIQGIVDAALFKAKNKDWSARQAAAGVKDKDWLVQQKKLDWLVQQAAQETLVALAPYASALQLQGMLDGALAEVDDENNNDVRQTAKQILATPASYISISRAQEAVDPIIKRNIRQATKRILVAIAPYLSVSRIQEVVEIIIKCANDEYRGARTTAHQTLAMLIPYASPSQIQDITDAAWIGVQDKSKHLRQAAQQTLAVLAPRIFASQRRSIVGAILKGIKDKESDVRQAAQETLAAIVSYLSAVELQNLLDTLAAVRNKDNDIRRAAQQVLAAFVPHSPDPLQLIEVALAGVRDDDKSVREAAQKTLVVLTLYLSDSYLQDIVSRSLTSPLGVGVIIDQRMLEALVVFIPRLSASQVRDILSNSNSEVIKAIYTALVQYAKEVTLEQAPEYCSLISEAMQTDDTIVQFIMLSGFPILQQRFGTLESYLITLQAERNQASPQEAQTPTWFNAGSIYEQLEAQVVDFYVPDGLQENVKAYEGATQAALQTLEDCKTTMEVVVAPELQPNQQQFFKHQAALFEQYHVLEQQRITAFQTLLANQPEALTPEAFTTAQAQFAKEQAEAKAVFQAELQTFYEQSSDHLNGETKLDVSELLQKRRAFLDMQLEQREVQAREQQTLFTQWQHALQNQAREIIEEPQESKAEKPAVPARKKSLPESDHQTAQLQQLQQALQTLRAEFDSSRQQSFEDQQRLQLQHRQLDVLLRERQQAQQLTEAIAAIQDKPILYAFYRCIQLKLSECFVACKAIASGVVAPAVSQGSFGLSQGIALVGVLLPLPYAALIATGISKGIEYLDERRTKQNSKLSSGLLGSIVEMDQLAEKIARLLTWRYETQIQQLTHESAVLLAESAVACMMEGLRTRGAMDPQKPLAEQMIQTMYEDHRLIKLPHLLKTKLTTRSGKTDWTASSVLLKTGIALWDKESLTFSFYAQKLHKDPSKKPQHDLGSKPEKYGYRLGSLQEITRLDLRRRADVPADISTAFTTSIGLRFMDVPTKQRATRLEMPVLLPPPPQAAAASSEPPEEKEQPTPRPPTPRPSRADVSIDQEENDGNGASTAPHKIKKQVRFSENIYIILPKPRSSEQDDSPSRSRSPSPLRLLNES